MESTKCRAEGCNADIVFARDAMGGHFLPIDVTPPIYKIRQGESFVVAEQVERGTVGVLHFATCKSPEKFSKRGKRGHG